MIGQLSHLGFEAMQDYDLTVGAKAAIVSSDIGWIEPHMGKLEKSLSR